MKRRRSLLLAALLLCSATAVGVAVRLTGADGAQKKLVNNASIAAGPTVDIANAELLPEYVDSWAHEITAPLGELDIGMATDFAEDADLDAQAMHELPDLRDADLLAGPDMNVGLATFSSDPADQRHPGYSAMNVGGSAFGTQLGGGSRNSSAKQGESTHSSGHPDAQNGAGNTPPDQTDLSAPRAPAPEQSDSPAPEQLTVDDGHTSVASDHSNHLSPVATDQDRAVSVPEPGTLGLWGLGLAGISLARRKKAVRPSPEPVGLR